MKKILAALATGVVGVLGVFFARAEGLLTEKVAADILFMCGYSTMALLLSWVLTAFAGSRHRAWAMGSAAALMIAGGVYRWGMPPIGYLALTAIVAISSPLVFLGVEAALSAVGIKLRKGADGEVEGVKVGDDETIWIGSPTEPPTVPKEGKFKPEPSNE
jgi:hypothetical protein